MHRRVIAASMLLLGLGLLSGCGQKGPLFLPPVKPATANPEQSTAPVPSAQPTPAASTATPAPATTSAQPATSTNHG